MSKVEIRAAGETHVGNVREANEDALLLLPELGFYAVLDGMGGHMAGDIASQKARDVISEYVTANGQAMEPRLLLTNAINAASAAVNAEAKGRRDRHGMGTTVVACQLVGDRAIVAHVGDSRAYLFRDGRLNQLTEDHTVVAELIANGAITPEEALRHPYKSVLSRNLGAKPEVKVDVREVALQPGDRVLLCSDGLTGFASHDAVEQMLGGAESPDLASRELVELALRGGGGDNVTVAVLDAGRKQLPRSTQIIRTTGSAAWWERRQLFSEAARQRGVAQSPICAVLSPDEAVDIVAGNLCEAIYHDLEQTTGINVWTFAENLASGWLDQGGGYPVLRDLLDVLRVSAAAVIADIARSGAEFAISLEVAVTRSFTVAEMAVGGQLAQRVRALEAELAQLQQVQTKKKRTFTEQPTVPYMRAFKAEPPSPDVVALLDRVIALAQSKLIRIPESSAADDCLQCAHRLCSDTVGDASLAARELFGSRALEDAGVVALLESLDRAREIHLAATQELDSDPRVRAAAWRRVATAHQSLYSSLTQLIVEAGRPFSDSLAEAAEITSQLRMKLGQGEARLAKLERSLVTVADDGPMGAG